MNDVELLAEIEDILRLMPPKATLRHKTEENFSWFGRVVAAIAFWNQAQGAAARKALSQFHDAMAIPSQKGLASVARMERSAIRGLF